MPLPIAGQLRPKLQVVRSGRNSTRGITEDMIRVGGNYVEYIVSEAKDGILDADQIATGVYYLMRREKNRKKKGAMEA